MTSSLNNAACAETLANALGGRTSGKGWTARCPAHDDLKPSLSICDADGKVLVHCHAGCTQDAVLTALRQRGFWPGNVTFRIPKLFRKASAKAEGHHEESERTNNALKIWDSAKPAGGTLVETYLHSRGLYLPWSQTMRFCSRLKHPSGRTWPAMVALVTGGVNEAPQAIHRTFLARDGSGKAPIDPQRMMLGPCNGGAVRLAPSSDILMVGEGIETCLAAMQASGYPAWAALSTSGLVVDARPEKPRLLVESHSPDTTIAELRDILLGSGELYDRGMPVHLVFDQSQKGMVARVMTPDDLVLMAHRLCRPYAINKDGEERNVRFPRPFATMYLGWCEGWKLPPLNGIASAPFLNEDGMITSAEGYDHASGMWCENVPDLADRVPEHPTRSKAEAALLSIREAFKTFCFADAETLEDPSGIAIVDTGRLLAETSLAFWWAY